MKHALLRQQQLLLPGKVGKYRGRYEILLPIGIMMAYHWIWIISSEPAGTRLRLWYPVGAAVAAYPRVLSIK